MTDATVALSNRLLLPTSSNGLSLAAVIVTFNPKPDALSRLLRTLARHAEKVVVVDNASNNVADINAAVASREQSVELIANASNLGIAVALNQGLRRCIEWNCELAILFDQDSDPDAAMISALLRAHQALSKQCKVSAVGPVTMDPNSGFRFPFMRIGKFKYQPIDFARESPYIRADMLITSGSLLALSAFQAIGQFDERLFIDHVDTEWFLRANSMGYACFGITDAVMRHSLGESLVSVRLWRKLTFPLHNPLRNYYMYRNTLLMCKMQHVPWNWCVNDLYRLASMLILMVFAPHRLARLRRVGRGVIDGLRGRFGKSPID